MNEIAPSYRYTFIGMLHHPSRKRSDFIYHCAALTL